MSDHIEGGPDCTWYKVKVTEELFKKFGAEGIYWGEPDSEGFYTPTVVWPREPVCQYCGHGHTEAAWSDRDPDDGTCWNAGSLVCGCPKFITPQVAAIRRNSRLRNL
jgi:hypothetical protein